MSKLLFFTLIITLFFLQAFAADSPTPSASRRFGVLGYPVMMSYVYSTVNLGNGVGANYALSENFEVFGSFTRSCAFLFKTDNFCFKGLSFGFKSFLSRSTYWKASLSQKSIDFHSDTGRNLAAELTLLDLAIGNYWGEGNFGIGVDWLGISKPFASRFTTDQIDGVVDAKKLSDQTDSRNKIQSDYQINLMSIYFLFNF